MAGQKVGLLLMLFVHKNATHTHSFSMCSGWSVNLNVFQRSGMGVTFHIWPTGLASWQHATCFVVLRGASCFIWCSAFSALKSLISFKQRALPFCFAPDPIHDVADPVVRDQSWKKEIKPFYMSDTYMGKIFKCHMKKTFITKYGIFSAAREEDEYLSQGNISRTFYLPTLNVKDPLEFSSPPALITDSRPPEVAQQAHAHATWLRANPRAPVFSCCPYCITLSASESSRSKNTVSVLLMV